jgi:hypothetical protein
MRNRGELSGCRLHRQKVGSFFYTVAPERAERREQVSVEAGFSSRPAGPVIAVIPAAIQAGDEQQ